MDANFWIGITQIMVGALAIAGKAMAADPSARNDALNDPRFRDLVTP